MNCPKRKVQTRVTDSRWKESAWAVRRRIECPECNQRFTTYEKIEDIGIAKANAISKEAREMADRIFSFARLIEANYAARGSPIVDDETDDTPSPD